MINGMILGSSKTMVLPDIKVLRDLGIKELRKGAVLDKKHKTNKGRKASETRDCKG